MNLKQLKALIKLAQEFGITIATVGELGSFNNSIKLLKVEK
jgi:hypothetical protein